MHKKKIFAIILLLPTLVFLLHAIIPHHHHFDEYFGADLIQHCKDMHHEQEKPDFSCCHAFNSSNIHIRHYSLVNKIITILAINILKPSIIFFNNTYKNILTNKIDSPKQGVFALLHLRAPPLQIRILY